MPPQAPWGGGGRPGEVGARGSCFIYLDCQGELVLNKLSDPYIMPQCRNTVHDIEVGGCPEDAVIFVLLLCGAGDAVCSEVCNETHYRHIAFIVLSTCINRMKGRPKP